MLDQSARRKQSSMKKEINCQHILVTRSRPGSTGGWNPELRDIKRDPGAQGEGWEREVKEQNHFSPFHAESRAWPSQPQQDLMSKDPKLLPWIGQIKETSLGIKTLLTFFFLINFYWSIVALQCCVSFYCTAKWISYTYTYIPSVFGSPSH